MAGKVQAARDAIRLVPEQALYGLSETALNEIEVVVAARERPQVAASLERFGRPLSGSSLAQRLIGMHPIITSRYTDLRFGLRGQWRRYPRPRTATFDAVLARWQDDIPLFPAQQRRREFLKLGWMLLWTDDLGGARRALAAAEEASKDTMEWLDLTELTSGWLGARAPDQALRAARRLPVENRASVMIAVARLYLDQGNLDLARQVVDEAYAAADAEALPGTGDSAATAESRQAAYGGLVPLQLRLGDREGAARRAAMVPGLHAPTPFWIDVLPAEVRGGDESVEPDRSRVAMERGVALYEAGAREAGLARLSPLADGVRLQAGEQLVLFGFVCARADPAVAEVAEMLRLPARGRVRLVAAARCLRMDEGAAAGRLLAEALAEIAAAGDTDGLSEVATAALLADRPDLVAAALAAEAGLHVQDGDPPRRARGLATVAAQAAELLR